MYRAPQFQWSVGEIGGERLVPPMAMVMCCDRWGGVKALWWGWGRGLPERSQLIAAEAVAARAIKHGSDW